MSHRLVWTKGGVYSSLIYFEMIVVCSQPTTISAFSENVTSIDLTLQGLFTIILKTTNNNLSFKRNLRQTTCF